MSSRHIPSNLDGVIDRQVITDDETCVVISNTTRVAAIKLLGSMSRNAYTEKGLSDKEIMLIRLTHTNSESHYI